MKPPRFLILIFLMLSFLFLPNIFAQGFQPYRILEPEKGAATLLRLAFSPDGFTLASSSTDGLIRLWDVETGELFDTLKQGNEPSFCLAFSPDGELLANGNNDSNIYLWDVVLGVHLDTFRTEARVLGLAFSPDGTTLASTSRDSGGGRGSLRLWDVETGISRHTLYEHPVREEGLAFSPDGTTLAVLSPPNTIALWDVATGERKDTLHVPLEDEQYMQHLAFSPEGILLIYSARSAYNAGELSRRRIEIHQWDTTTQQLRSTLLALPQFYELLVPTFSPDGSLLAGLHRDAVGYHDAIYLWDIATGQLLNTLYGHLNAYALAFSPDGTTLANLGEIPGKNVYLWDLSTRVNITPSPVMAPAIGEQLTVDVNITSTQNIAGYQVTVGFDSTALRYVKSANGDYLPAGAFFVPGIVDGNRVTIGAATLAGTRTGDGTLATLTFEVLALKESQLLLQDVRLRDSDIQPLLNFRGHSRVTLPPSVAAPPDLQRLSPMAVTSHHNIRFLEQLLAVLAPKETALLPNYPNPFNPETWIPYQLAQPAEVSVSIYAANGQQVRQLALGHQPAGIYQQKEHAAYWDGKNEHGEPVASGIYFYTLTAGKFTGTGKMLSRK